MNRKNIKSRKISISNGSENIIQNEAFGHDE